MSAPLDVCKHAAALYAQLRPLAGCCWHVVLEDRNVADSFVRDTSSGEERRDPCRYPEICKALKPILLQMSMTQRKKLAKGGYEA